MPKPINPDTETILGVFFLLAIDALFMWAAS